MSVSEEQAESRFDVEFREWPGFAYVLEARQKISEHADVLDTLEQHQADIRLRIDAAFDLVDTFRRSAGAAVPVDRLADVLTYLAQMRDNIQATIDTPTSAEQNATAIFEASANVLWSLRPHVPPEVTREAEALLASARTQAVSAVHGVRVSAGHARKDIESGVTDVLDRLEAHKQSLETALREAIEGMNTLAAEARTRMEGSLSTTVTNAQAELERMRQTGEQLAAQLDQTYRETVDQLKQDIGTASQERDGMVTKFDETYKQWSEALSKWQEELATAANTAREKLETTQAWADGIRGDIQIAALASGFAAKEKHHKERALWALISAAAFGAVAFTTAGVAFSIWYRIRPDASPSEIARDIALRLVLAAIPLTAATFAARVYRTHSHLATVYGERAAAATAFEGFAARAREDDIADQLLVALAQLVFAGRDTGHHTEEQIVPSAALSGLATRFLSGK